MMKFILGVFVSFILGACSSDSGILNPDEEVPVQAETRCCQAAVSSGDSLSRMIRVHSRGWEPSLGNQYPLDYVYILSDIEDDPGEYKPVQSKNEVKMPVASTSGNSHIDMCFQVGPGAGPSNDPNDSDDDEVYLTIDGKTIEVDDCMFSSVSLGKAVMDKSTSLSTPNGKEVYEPFGDRLFFSEYVIEAEFKHGKLKLERKSGGHDLPDLVINSGDRIEIPLKRFTAAVNTKLIISRLKWLQKHKITKAEFEDTFGRLKDWRVRVFLRNAPTVFNYGHMYNYQSGKGIIALSQNELEFSAEMSHTDIKESPKTCEGIGVVNDSEPYIFPMKTNSSEICYSFYYTGSKEVDNKPILERTTICIPIGIIEGKSRFEANYRYNLTHRLDVEDFKNGVTGVYDKKTKAVVENDPILGRVIHLPYEVSVETENIK